MLLLKAHLLFAAICGVALANAYVRRSEDSYDDEPQRSRVAIDYAGEAQAAGGAAIESDSVERELARFHHEQQASRERAQDVQNDDLLDAAAAAQLRRHEHLSAEERATLQSEVHRQRVREHSHAHHLHGRGEATERAWHQLEHQHTLRGVGARPCRVGEDAESGIVSAFANVGEDAADAQTMNSYQFLERTEDMTLSDMHLTRFFCTRHVAPSSLSFSTNKLPVVFLLHATGGAAADFVNCVEGDCVKKPWHREDYLIVSPQGWHQEAMAAEAGVINPTGGNATSGKHGNMSHLYPTLTNGVQHADKTKTTWNAEQVPLVENGAQLAPRGLNRKKDVEFIKAIKAYVSSFILDF